MPAGAGARDISGGRGRLGLAVAGIEAAPRRSAEAAAGAHRALGLRMAGPWLQAGRAGSSSSTSFPLKSFSHRGSMRATWMLDYDVADLCGRCDSRPRSGGSPQDEPRTLTPGREDVPEQYRGQVGGVTVAKTVPQLRGFMENGRDDPCHRDLDLHRISRGAPRSRMPWSSGLRTERRAVSSGRNTIFRARSSRPGWTRTIPWPAGWPSGRISSSTTAPFFPSGPRGSWPGSPTGRLVRRPRSPAKRLGLGTELSRPGCGRHRSSGGSGPAVSLRAGHPFPRAAPRHIQAAVQRHLLRAGDPGPAGARWCVPRIA